MSKNYYEDLEIPRESSSNDIAKAKLALRWHPDTCQEDPNTANYYFNQISEAFEVLNDPIKKAFYDKYGEEKLKSGLYTETDLVGGYRYKNNAQEIYDQFFGDKNAFDQIFSTFYSVSYSIDVGTEQKEGTIFGSAFGNQNFKGTTAPPNLIVKVPCTLKEIYNGCYKQVQFQKVVLNNDGRTTKQINETKNIQITRGIANGTKIKFTGEGHQARGFKPSDLICIIDEQSTPQCVRKGNDLIKYVSISLADALQSKSVNFTSFDGRELSVSNDQVINPQTIKQVKGEGMCDPNEPEKRGDMFLKFNIKFPKNIEHSKLSELIELLK